MMVEMTNWFFNLSETALKVSTFPLAKKEVMKEAIIPNPVMKSGYKMVFGWN